MKYKEGIDRIAVLLNPLYFRKENIIKHKDPYKRLTLHPAGQFTVLSIHEEWFNPFQDYQCQIAFAIYELIKEGVVEFPNTFLTPLFIYKYHELFILNIVACEFFSDFKEENIEIDEDMVELTIDKAKEEGALYRFIDKEKNKITDTYYSPDKSGARKSVFISYDKIEKLLKDNNKASKKEILAHQNRIRCEYKITSTNSDWLHWDNFRGTYKIIFNRYKEYLAVIFNNYIEGCIAVHGKENPNFRKIIKIAKENNNIRFTNPEKKLKRKEVNTKEELYPRKVLTTKEINKKMDNNINKLNELATKSQSVKKAKEMNKTIDKVVKTHINND